MDVLQPVARHATTREVLIDFAHMTGRTIDLLVGALQRKFGFAVVVRLHPRPLQLGMAAFAFFSEPAFMRVDCLVTIETLVGRLSENNFRQVATLATDSLVCILKLIVRKAVIECFPVQLINVGVPPLVVCVTVPALLLRRIGLQPVEPFPRPAICTGFLVAIEAKPRLRLPRERLMALAAFILKLSMSLNNRTGYDEFF